jgi:hypothetical protein
MIWWITLGNGAQVPNNSAPDTTALILDHRTQDIELFNLRTVVSYVDSVWLGASEHEASPLPMR